MGLTKYREEEELDFDLSEVQSLLKVKGRGKQWKLGKYSYPPIGSHQTVNQG
jgi:hypothetical protein